MNLLLFQCSERDDDTVRGEFGDGHVCFEIVDPVGLSESPRDKPCFESDNFPFASCLALKTHLQVTRFLPGGSSTRSRAPFFIRDSYSSLIANFHSFAYTGWLTASS